MNSIIGILSYNYLQGNESVIIITSCVIIAILLVATLVFLTGRLFKIFSTSPSQVMESNSSYQGYPSVLPEPALFSNHSPVYGTVGRRARPLSGAIITDPIERYSQAQMYSYLDYRDTRLCDKEKTHDSYLYQ